MTHPFFITINTRSEQVSWAEADNIGDALQAVVTLWNEEELGVPLYAAEIWINGSLFATIRDPSLCRSILEVEDSTLYRAAETVRASSTAALAEVARRIRRPGARLHPGLENAHKPDNDENSFGL